MTYVSGTTINAESTLTFDGLSLRNGPGDWYSNSIHMMSNVYAEDSLIIGDVAEADTIADISFKVMSATNLVLGDGDNTFQGTVAFNGDLILKEDTNIRLDHTLAANQSSGIILPGIGTGTVVVNNVYYLNSSSAWTLTDADADTSATNLIAYANSSGTGSANRMVLQGIVFDLAHGFAVGAPIYLSNTPGALTVTVPSATADIARVVGYAITADEIYFKPDNTWVKIA